MLNPTEQRYSDTQLSGQWGLLYISIKFSLSRNVYVFPSLVLMGQIHCLCWFKHIFLSKNLLLCSFLYFSLWEFISCFLLSWLRKWLVGLGLEGIQDVSGTLQVLFFIFILFISVVISKWFPDTLFWESHTENLYFSKEPRTSAQLPIPEYSRGKTQSILLCREFFMEVCLSVIKLCKSHQPL